MKNKLFNINFLKQNLKKSKTLMIAITIIMPIINFCFMIISKTEDYADENFINMLEVNKYIENIGLVIVPLALSIILFGYVYNKRKIDLINSMPISKKSIYITNFIGGILVILVYQVLFALSEIFAIATINAEIFKFASMQILKSFAYYFAAYTFLFAAECLSSALVGNVVTSFAMTYADVLFVPALVYLLALSFEKGLTWIPKIYPIPFNRLSSLTLKVIITFIWVLIYGIIGFKVFQKKKMEYSGEGFRTERTEIILKDIILTIPYILFLSVVTSPRYSGIMPEGGTYFFETSTVIKMFIIFIIISLTLYAIADLIFNKRIKFKTNLKNYIVYMLVFGLIFGPTFYIYNKNKYDNQISVDNLLKVEKIKDITLNEFYISDNEDFTMQKYLDEDSSYHHPDLIVDDQNIINYVYSIYQKNEERRANRLNDVYNNKTGQERYNTLAISFNLKNGEEDYNRLLVTKKEKEKIYDEIEKSDSFQKFKENLKIKKNTLGLTYNATTSINNYGYISETDFNKQKKDANDLLNSDFRKQINEYIDRASTIEDLEDLFNTGNLGYMVEIYMYTPNGIISQNINQEAIMARVKNNINL